MAVYHCHTHAIGRSGKGGTKVGSALASAAYRSGEKLREHDGLEARERRKLSAAELAAYRTGEAVRDGSGKVHDYTRKGGVAHAEIVLPKGMTAEWASEREALWNAAERADTRKNSRLAREWRVALPHELDHGQRVELAREFAETIVERYGVAADVAVHAPSRSGDQRNWHAHILCTTREIANEGFGAKARIEWSNTNCKKAGIPYTSLQIREMRMAWEEHANEHLMRAGHENRVDHRSYAEQGVALEAARTVHVGQTYAEERDRVAGTERILPVERLDSEQSARNAEAIEADPGLILDRVASQHSAFTRRDVASTLHRFVNEDWRQFDRTLEAVMASDRLVNLVEEGRQADTGREVEAVWSTQEVATREAGMLDRAERLATSGQGGFSERSVERGIAAVERGAPVDGNRNGGNASTPSNGPSDASPTPEPFRLSEEQREAVRTLADDGQLAVLRGVAGTGKTTALSAFRETAEIEDRRIVGGALAGKATRELEDGSGIESRTLASWERSWDAGFDRLERGDVFVMDEAGMVGSAQMARVMERVEEADAKLVLVGDERQLQPIEAGAAFRDIKERAEERGDVAELTQVRRQSEGWQREASAAFGRGEVGEALDAYRERDAVRLHDSTEQARAAIVADYFGQLDAAREAQGTERPGLERIEAAAPSPSGEERDDHPSVARAQGLGAVGNAERTDGRVAERADRIVAGAGSVHSGDRDDGATREPDHIVTAYRNADVDALNGAIRAERVNRGELGEEATFRTERGEQRFAEGDKVLLTRNDRTLGMANGDRGEVIGVERDRLDVRMKDGREVRLEANAYEGVRHGYAVTTHRAQGMTVDRVHVMAGRGMDAPLAYVAMTRQREGATLHASRDDFRDYATLRESVSRERQARSVGDYLPRQGSALEAVRERIAATQANTNANRADQANRAGAEATAAMRTSERGMDASQRGENALASLAPSAPSDDRRERLRAALEEYKAMAAKEEPGRMERLRAMLTRERGAEREPSKAAGDRSSASNATANASGATADRTNESVRHHNRAQNVPMNTDRSAHERASDLRQRLQSHAARPESADERRARLRAALERDKGNGAKGRGAEGIEGQTKGQANGQGRGSTRANDRGSDKGNDHGAA